jgi:uncharacterized lipoprotein
MTLNRLLVSSIVATVAGGLAACGGPTISETCDEVQSYQLVVPGKRIVVPDGLDSLEEFKEMPIPKAETPPRPAGARCLESPPSILSGGTRDTSE